MINDSLQAMSNDELLELLTEIEDTKARAEEILLGRMSKVRQPASEPDCSVMLPSNTTKAPHCP
jgi:hypothetical protein